MNTTLLIMAAGIGSRFGTGIKQLEPVDASKSVPPALLVVCVCPSRAYCISA